MIQYARSRILAQEPALNASICTIVQIAPWSESRDRLECTIVHPEGLSGSIAQEVRRVRREQGLRQDELALAAGVSVRAVHQIEAGKPTTRLDVLERVLSALGLRVDLTPRHRRSASGERQ